MTENLAGRGEGLAGLASELREIADALWTTNATRGRQLREIAGRLEAAAPPSTAQRDKMGCWMAARDWCAHWTVSMAAVDSLAEMLMEFQCAALATPSPQAPPSEDTSWRWLRLRGYLRQWLTPHHFEIAMDCLDKAEAPPDVQLIEHEATMAEHNSHIEFENELYATLVDPVAEGSIKEADMRKQLLESARWYRQHVHDLENQLNKLQRVPAATQEQPAGSGATKHELFAWNDLVCKNCGLGVGWWPSQPECKPDSGSPRKVGEDELRAEMRAAGEHIGCLDDEIVELREALEKAGGALDLAITMHEKAGCSGETCSYPYDLQKMVRTACRAALARSSSVPVGEQKREEGV